MVIAIWISLDTSPVAAQTAAAGIIGGNIQKRASEVLALMGYTLTPDVTTGSLSISNGKMKICFERQPRRGHESPQ